MAAQSLTLVDTTKTSSWDDWAQGFRSDGIPNMNCPGQGTSHRHQRGSLLLHAVQPAEVPRRVQQRGHAGPHAPEQLPVQVL